jgi:aspartate aminotransferase-like enzyme
MFGPNVKADERGCYYHHRGDMFHQILGSLKGMFGKRFGLEDYDYLFLTGSGTTANETVIFSLGRARMNVLFDDAEFGNRLRNMIVAHGRNIDYTGKPITVYPLYETSISRFNLHKSGEDEVEFLDMVSAFPYYLPPKGTAIWTTVSSKQLGAYPVLGIVAIHKRFDLGEYVCNYRGSSLNLLDHQFYHSRNETLATAAIPLYFDLLNTIRNFDRGRLISTIDQRRKEILDVVGIDNVMGCGPVITFKNNGVIGSVAREFDLYKSDAGYQVFLWSGTDEEHKTFCDKLERKIKT